MKKNSSSNIRLIFVGQFFVMCRWAPRRRIRNVIVYNVASFNPSLSFHCSSMKLFISFLNHQQDGKLSFLMWRGLHIKKALKTFLGLRRPSIKCIFECINPRKTFHTKIYVQHLGTIWIWKLLCSVGRYYSLIRFIGYFRITTGCIAIQL